MSNIDKQALREAADAANETSWGRWESYHPHKGARGYEVKVGVKAIAQHCLKVDSEFIAAANPATVLALLDELEKEKGYASAYECEKWHYHQLAESEGERADRAEKALVAAEKRCVELAGRAFNPAILDVIAEHHRHRQVTYEGWTTEHDDKYQHSEMLWAASCYVLNTIQKFNRVPLDWPWRDELWKPTEKRRDLVKAGALIIAEIERIDRVAGIGKGE
ncbi:ead/Ea22-like family protein [Citrobacter amalonaticus]|uniref:ead/Ea22-like family protein n=1 Tax=Citrobacter amalonaticus TaxID=35703 RepID=UPI00388F7B12